MDGGRLFKVILIIKRMPLRISIFREASFFIDKSLYTQTL